MKGTKQTLLSFSKDPAAPEVLFSDTVFQPNHRSITGLNKNDGESMILCKCGQESSQKTVFKDGPNQGTVSPQIQYRAINSTVVLFCYYQGINMSFISFIHSLFLSLCQYRPELFVLCIEKVQFLSVDNVFYIKNFRRLESI